MLTYTEYDTRLAGYALVRDDRGRVLLSRWIEDDQPRWSCPGGGIEFGETIEQGTVRELFEESGYHVAVGALLGVLTLDVPAEQRLHANRRPMRAVQVFHEGVVTGGELTHEVGGSSDQAAWFTPQEIAHLDRVPTVDHMLALAGIRFDA